MQRRELVRFEAVSQPQAGAFLNAVPKFEAFRIQTWAMPIAVQKRLGLRACRLPLLAAAGAVGSHGQNALVNFAHARWNCAKHPIHSKGWTADQFCPELPLRDIYIRYANR